MLKFRFYFLSIVFISLLLTSCEKDEEKVNEAEVLVEYLESANSPLMKDYMNTELPSIMSASEVYTLNTTGEIYIIDIRKEADFNLGHIKNANLVAVSDIFTHCESIDMASYTKVAVVCYSGQTAGFATSLLRLKGYDNVYSMKFGMASWHSDFAVSYKNTVSNGNAYATQFTSDATAKGPMGDLPTLSTGFDNGSDILESRLNTVLEAGFDAVKISNQAVMDNKDSYYIVNYWPENHYTTPGHIPGAMQYTPKESLKLAADLKTLPTDKTIVVYCYTGQTSAYLAAQLSVMGYDVKTLLYGCNGMIYDKMVDAGITSVFSDTQIIEKEYE